MMKRIIQMFQEANVEEYGWLKIKGKHLGRDKQKHIVLGIPIFVLSFLYLYFFEYQLLDDGFEHAIENAFGITVAVAVAKEVVDFILFKIGKKANFQPIPDIISTVFVPFCLLMISKLF